MSSSYILSDNGASSGSAGLKQQAGNDGVLLLQTTTSGGTATTAVTINTSQNVGVGVTPSAWNSARKVIQVGAGSSLVASTTGASFTEVGANTYLNSGASDTYIGSDYASKYRQANGAHNWYTAASGTAGNAISFTQAMTLDASGNLGVGTTSPGSKLHSLSSTNTPAIIETSGGTSTYLQLKNTGGSAYIGSVSNDIAFYTSGSATERARIDSSGNLLVGMTSTSGQSGVSIVPASATYTAIHHASGSASGTEYLLFRYNGSGIGSITQNGTTGVLYNLTSDYRLKSNQQPLTGAKEFVMGLQPKTWDWWDGSGEGVGFIAHEFMEVAKYSGHGEKDAVDEDGNPVYQSIQPSSSEVMANLVALLQEQQAIITQLQADVAALKGTP